MRGQVAGLRVKGVGCRRLAFGSELSGYKFVVWEFIVHVCSFGFDSCLPFSQVYLVLAIWLLGALFQIVSRSVRKGATIAKKNSFDSGFAPNVRS